jgi:hypothetical protein
MPSQPPTPRLRAACPQWYAFALFRSCRAGLDTSFIACHTYTDHPPILQVEDEHVSVSVSPRDPKRVTADDLAQAHRLADALAQYIAELESHVTVPGPSEGVAA